MQNSDIEKCIPMAASNDNFFWKFSWMTASQRQLQRYIYLREILDLLEMNLASQGTAPAPQSQKHFFSLWQQSLVFSKEGYWDMRKSFTVDSTLSY